MNIFLGKELFKNGQSVTPVLKFDVNEHGNCGQATKYMETAVRNHKILKTNNHQTRDKSTDWPCTHLVHVPRTSFGQYLFYIRKQ